MNQLVEAILRFLRNFKLWVIVSPWEQAVRVRLGKTVHVLETGPHLRLPLIDVIYVQSTRLRFTTLDRQTITTKDRIVVTVAGSVGYEIVNLERLYRTVHHAEDTIRQIARGAVAEFLGQQDAAGLTVEKLSEKISESCDLSMYGLKTVQVIITDFATVRTYRLIGDYAAGYQNGSALSTESQEKST